MPSQLNSISGLSSSSAGFKIRRVASGLLPQQVRPDSNTQIHPETRPDNNGTARVETPVSSKEVPYTMIRTKASTNFSTPKFPLQGTPIDHYLRLLDSDRVTIRNEKIIGDNNEFDLPSAQMFADRNLDPEFFEKHIMNQPDFEKLVDEPDIEFDPSDHDISDTSPSVHREERANARASTALDRSPPKLDSYVSSLTRTPRRKSPLRQVVGISSNVKSVAEEIADEIARSGATKSKTAEEILVQINSSVEKLRENDNTFLEALDADEDSDEDKDILKSLDDILPKEPSPLKSQLGVSATPRNDQVLPEPIDGIRSQPLNIPNLNDSAEIPQKSLTRRQLGTSRKLSGKYARDVLRKRKIKNGAPYGFWQKEKWAKLKQLMQLSIPREVIANSKLVMQDLQCGKKELADRIYFLEHHKRP